MARELKVWTRHFTIEAKELTPNLKLLFNPASFSENKLDNDFTLFYIRQENPYNWLQVILAMRYALDDKTIDADFVGSHEENCKHILERLAAQFGQSFDSLDEIFEGIELFDVPLPKDLMGFAQLLDDGHGIKSISNLCFEENAHGTTLYS